MESLKPGMQKNPLLFYEALGADYETPKEYMESGWPKYVVYDTVGKDINPAFVLDPKQKYDERKVSIENFSMTVFVPSGYYISENDLKETVAESIEKPDDYTCYLKDIRDASNQILEKYGKDETLYVSIGQSPKQVAWDLKIQGAKVCSINVSNAGAEKCAPEYMDYVVRKIGSARKNFASPVRNLVLIDFSNSGETLRSTKKHIESVLGANSWPGEVKTAAILALGNSRNEDMDLRVFAKSLGADLCQEKLKRMGRNHPKNYVATWNDLTHARVDWSAPRYEVNKKYFKDALNDQWNKNGFQERRQKAHVLAGMREVPIASDNSPSDDDEFV